MIKGEGVYEAISLLKDQQTNKKTNTHSYGHQESANEHETTEHTKITTQQGIYTHINTQRVDQIKRTNKIHRIEGVSE